MNDILIDDNFDENNIKIKNTNNNIFVKKIEIFNENCNAPMQKIWILIENTKIVYINKKTISITFSQKNKALNNIKSIEEKVIKKIENIFGHKYCVNSKLISDMDNIINFDLSYDTNTSYFDKNDNQLNESDINICDNVFVICELDEITICNSCLTILWKIIQMKKYETINTKLSLFANTKPQQPIQQQIQTTIPQYKPENNIFTVSATEQKIEKKHENTSKSEQLPPKKIAFMPSSDDLLKALTSLKKTKTQDENVQNINVLHQISTIPKLNHVITKEAIPMVDILKKEYNDKNIIMNQYVKMKKDYKGIKHIINKYKSKINKVKSMTKKLNQRKIYI